MSSITPSEVPFERRSSNRLVQRLKDLSIGNKLSFGFATLLALMIILVLLSFLASASARSDFQRTESLRLPSALATADLELEMHEMIGNLQGYLALGDAQFLESFRHDVGEVEELMEGLIDLSAGSAEQDSVQQLQELQIRMDAWLALTDELIALRDSPLRNQPGLRIVLQQARPAEADNVESVSAVLEEQALREPTQDNMQLLKTMAEYQGSFNSMIAAIDGYVATTDPSSKEMYFSALARNDEAWEGLNGSRELLTPGQRIVLARLTEARQNYLTLSDEIFAAVEGEHGREDAYLFRTQVLPMAEEIANALGKMRVEQVTLLSQDVSSGNARLSDAQLQTTIGTVIAIFVAVNLALAIRHDIAGPITRLTRVTSRITQGDFKARATVESRDEIGRLAASLNAMTDQLERSLVATEQRARSINTSSRVGRRLSAILDQDQLITEVVNQVQSAFDYYYVHVFLLDEGGKTLISAGGAGDAGRELVARGFAIPLEKGLVGRAARTRTAVFVPDVAQDESYLPNSLLPETKTEITVPIVAGKRVLGVLDVQHSFVGGLTSNDVDFLQTIAGQVASALLNARSYAETQRRANRETRINEISQRILNTRTMDEALKVAAREVGRAVGARRTSVRLDLKDGRNGHS